jgi:hypothetical protein
MEFLRNKVQSINAISLTSNVKDWLENNNHPRILHVFDQVCNLINKRGEILSIVSPEIRNGPFNIVIEEDVRFSRHLGIESPISIFQNQLMLADLTINTKDAKFWNPCPNWEKLHDSRYRIFNQLISASLPDYQPSIPYSMGFILSRELANADISAARAAASQLAGLGQGLTPSGDDFIMGAILAAWIIHPVNTAKVLAEEVARSAASLTTSLSAAWLRSAGKGEAGSLWHYFFDALLSENPMTMQGALENLHHVGHTSGDDALAGFTSTFISYAEREPELCLS